MLVRCFYGTEITDEAFYISDALTMMHGNTLYSYENYFIGSGFTILIVPFLFVFELFMPDHTGVVLYTRICFMLFWFSVLYIAYKILRKRFKRAEVLLFISILIPFAGGASIYNFNYNTIPCALTLLGGVLLYDVLENQCNRKKIKLFSIGFMMAIAFMAHPTYVVAIFMFSLLIVFRSHKGEKIRNLLLCICGGVLEVLIVVIPIILQTGLPVFIEGIRNLLHPYPSGKKSNYTTSDVKLQDLSDLYNRYFQKVWLPFVIVFGALIVMVLIFYLVKWISKDNLRKTIISCILLAWSIGIAFLLYDICILMTDQAEAYKYRTWPLGIAGTIGIAGLFLFIVLYRDSLEFYLGWYPGIFSLVLAVASNNSANASRFSAAVPALAVFFLLLLHRDFFPLKLLVVVTAIFCTVCLCINDYCYVYRDADVQDLTVRTTEGVYSGIMTTETRARDLPELEQYLNQFVEENEYYAFRDNVPAGYLMMHQGKMCDRATWDCMQFTYNLNAPDNLYAYYQRRGAIPDKIIYVDFGRDEQLSIECEDYLYNEFVHAYYTRISDTELNETFRHVIVYEYSGGFDGNLEEWINRHMYIETDKESDHSA